jgi:hypothetical protein
VYSLRAVMLAMLALASTSFAQVDGGTAQAAAPKATPAAKSFENALTLAPNIGWTTGTQQQTLLGGSGLVSRVRSETYCDPHMEQFGLVASASDSTTKKLGGTPTYLDSNDLRFDATTAVFGGGRTRSYLSGAADFFDNNSLGVGLQQIYSAKYQYYFTPCPSPTPEQAAGRTKYQRWFASVGIGAGFMRQRLYSTVDQLNAAVLPLTVQVSYLEGGGQKKGATKAGADSKANPPSAFWYFLAGYMPALTDSHAYQLSAIAGVQIPTRIPMLKINISDSDLYMENAPAGHRKNYQNGTVSLVFSFSSKVKGSQPTDTLGACYGGDKLQRLYCYDQVTADSCSPPNLFRPKSACSSAGAALLNE